MLALNKFFPGDASGLILKMAMSMESIIKAKKESIKQSSQAFHVRKNTKNFSRENNGYSLNYDWILCFEDNELVKREAGSRQSFTHDIFTKVRISHETKIFYSYEISENLETLTITATVKNFGVVPSGLQNSGDSEQIECFDLMEMIPCPELESQGVSYF